jgi:ribonuclease HI
MELRAVIEGLGAVRERCVITVRTDSQYVKNGITKWIVSWKAKGWVHKVKGMHGKQPIKNRDLWEELDHLANGHDITWEWVKGHSTDTENIRCDLLANSAAKRLVEARQR